MRNSKRAVLRICLRVSQSTNLRPLTGETVEEKLAELRAKVRIRIRVVRRRFKLHPPGYGTIRRGA